MLFWYAKKVQKGLTDKFYGYKKSRKLFGFGIDSYLKDGAWRNAIGRLRAAIISKSYLLNPG